MQNLPEKNIQSLERGQSKIPILPLYDLQCAQDTKKNIKINGVVRQYFVFVQTADPRWRFYGRIAECPKRRHKKISVLKFDCILGCSVLGTSNLFQNAVQIADRNVGEGRLV